MHVNYHHHHHHNHQILLLLVGHRASMKRFQALRSPAIPLTSFHDLPVPLISSSIGLRHVLFSLPFLLYPWGFQSNAVFSIAPTSLRSVCPIQFLVNYNTGTSGTTTFIVFIRGLHVSTYTQVIFRPYCTCESIKSYARWDPIALTSFKAH